MQIISITLTNFRRHRSLTVDLQPGVVGIIGRNGTGKSSLLEGLYFGITGGSIGEDTKSALLTWGQKRGEVVIQLLIDGKPGTLIRRVNGKSASLDIEGEEKAVGIQAVNAKLAELLGISLGHLRDILFVPQENLDAPLRGTDATRKEAFGKLFGCHRIEGVRNVLQNALASFSDGSEQGMAVQRQTLESMLAKALQEEEEARAALDEIEKQEQQGPSASELYRIAEATPKSRVDAEREALTKALEAVDAGLSGFGQEETSAWNPEKSLERLAHANAVITLFDTGVCPTCGLTGGGTGETRESAVAMAQAARTELERKATFDRLMSELVDIDNANHALNDRSCELDDVIANAKETLSKRAVFDRELRNAYSRHGAATATLEAARTALAEHVRREAQTKARLTTAGTLIKVRECLHRDALQADVREYGASVINTWLTDMLSIFTIPYQVYFNTEGLLKFKALPSEAEHDFLDLSGGQRKLVALAYRLSLMRLFMGNLNLAVLDEPTPFIDEENVEMMCESFQSLRRFSVQKGMTVLVATHEKRLFSAFDRMIEL